MRTLRDQVPRRDESGAHLTPMIDVVLQLIVFFLLTLSFHSVEARLETRLPEPGLLPRPAFPVPAPVVKVALFREDAGGAARAFTRVRIGGRRTVDLPPGPGGGDAAPEARRAYDAARDEIRDAVAEVWTLQGRPPDAEGEIHTPWPKGAFVPHGDVVAVLDAFLEVGLRDVRFQGSPPPR